jgi:hypothetical protein
MEDRPPQYTYQIKVVLRGISPMIWRRFLMFGQETLGEFHRVDSGRLRLDRRASAPVRYSRPVLRTLPTGGLWFDTEKPTKFLWLT